jgi:D-sedoheptulose 7-phosphate isomerase
MEQRLGGCMSKKDKHTLATEGRVKLWVDEGANLFYRMNNSDTLREKIAKAGVLIFDTLRVGGKVLACGAGGSSSDSAHLTAEMLNRFTLQREYSLPAIDLSAMNSTITAISNDYGFEFAFSKQLESLGKEEDALIAITTSGESPVIINTINKAIEKNMDVIVLTSIRFPYDLPDNCIIIDVPHKDTPHIQEAHILIIHAICDAVDYLLNTYEYL